VKQAFFSVSPRDFYSFNCETKASKCFKCGLKMFRFLDIQMSFGKKQTNKLVLQDFLSFAKIVSVKQLSEKN